MTDIQMFPHCRPITSHYDFSGSFVSQDDAFAFANKHSYNVIVNTNDTTHYYFSHITKVNVRGELKYAFGKNVGRSCDCKFTYRSSHHQKDEARNLCIDPNPLLTEIDSLFDPVTESEKAYNTTAWRIDSYKTVNIC